MNNIPFGKFFDMQKDQALVDGMELIESKTDLGSTIYLFKNKFDGNFYAVLDDDYSHDIGAALETMLGYSDWVLGEIPPKNPDLYAGPYSIARASVKE